MIHIMSELSFSIKYRHLIPTPVGWTSDRLYNIHELHVKNKYTNDQHSLGIKGTFSNEVIYASMPRKLDGNRAFGRVLCRVLSTHLVQELNVDTVVDLPNDQVLDGALPFQYYLYQKRQKKVSPTREI